MRIIKIIESNRFLDSISLFMRIGGITLYPFIVIREGFTKDDKSKVISHELIHIEQQKELLIIGFYIWNLVEWLVRLFMKGDAYKNISFEREAYSNEDNYVYYKNRKRFTFLKHIKE
jgi:hypothetical protein